MTVIDKLKGAAINAFLGTPGQSARSALAEARRRFTGESRRVDFYYDATDPGSHLLAQVVQRLARAYPVEFAFHVVTAPASDVDPAPDLRIRHAVRDALDLAQQWDVVFPGKKEADPGAVKKALTVLIKERPFAQQLDIAIELGAALWANDGAALTRLQGAHGTEAPGAIAPILAANYGELRDRGFYRGTSLSYGGDWFTGIERVRYLEDRLAHDTGVAAAPVLTARAPETRPPARLAKTDRVPLEVWFSFRSPYSYLAIERLAARVDTWPVELRLRPVLPLEMRGTPMIPVKRMYMARDAKREADRLGIPFGNLCDPLGTGAENCLAIARVAIDAGVGLDFLRSAARGIWSEARDMASYVDLRHVVERAGMSWDTARAALGDPAWKDWVKTSADDLALAGLWGVPGFRAGDYVTWGQDRIDFLDDRLRRHAAAASSP
jgi:2-hydroxychromene-2-carboxylate isomerase